MFMLLASIEQSVNRYTAADLDDLNKLSREDQQIAKVLACAEQERWLDVYLIMINHQRHTSVLKQEFNMCDDRVLQYNHAVVDIQVWRTLSGADAGLTGKMDLDGSDRILPVHLLRSIMLLGTQPCSNTRPDGDAVVESSVAGLHSC